MSKFGNTYTVYKGSDHDFNASDIKLNAKYINENIEYIDKTTLNETLVKGEHGDIDIDILAKIEMELFKRSMYPSIWSTGFVYAPYIPMYVTGLLPALKDIVSVQPMSGPSSKV